MPVVQISRIQHRRGKATDLPQLAAGELGWVIDDQKLYIGNGTVADGAPAVGNTEILTGASNVFSAATDYIYKGYLGTNTPILTGAVSDHSRTLQARLDDYVSVKGFGAVGDGSTNDTAAVQRAIDELYRDTDKTDVRSRRMLFFPAGTYKTTGITIPPYATLVGEGADKSIITQTGGNTTVAVTEDNAGNTGSNIGNAGATKPTFIHLQGLTFKNLEAYGGLSIDQATNVRAVGCKFMGTYVLRGSDVQASKGITVTSETASVSSNIIFESCLFTKFARLVDLSYDAVGIKFTNCDFDTAYYGAYIGEIVDGSSDGLTKGPKDVQFLSSRWSNIGQNAILVANAGEIKQIVSNSNWYADTVGNNFEGVDSIREVPVIQFNADECLSTFDYFDRTDQRTSTLNPPAEVQGIGIQNSSLKQITLADNTSSATSTGIRLPALAGKSVKVNYKIERNNTHRAGVLFVSAYTSGESFSDDYEEPGSDVGITLTAVRENLDSTSGNESLTIKFTSTNTGSDATMDYQVTTIV